LAEDEGNGVNVGVVEDFHSMSTERSRMCGLGFKAGQVKVSQSQVGRLYCRVWCFPEDRVSTPLNAHCAGAGRRGRDRCRWLRCRGFAARG
jgi:hypothetical protein